jgi:hypothetical protein
MSCVPVNAVRAPVATPPNVKTPECAAPVPRERVAVEFALVGVYVNVPAFTNGASKPNAPVVVALN